MASAFAPACAALPRACAGTRAGAGAGSRPGWVALERHAASDSLRSRDLLPSLAPLAPCRAPSSAQRGRVGAGMAPRCAFGVVPREVLIINTNSGGHAVITFWLAKRLRGFGHGVTVLTVGEEGSPKMDKPPFTRFNELREVGVRTLWGDPSQLSAVLGDIAMFDTVLDNNGKDMEAVQPVVDWAQRAGVKQFLFVSSAGIYKTGTETPHIEGDAVKEDSGHALVEKYIGSKAWENGWAAFRPQYITGSANNKDCEEWFFDRIVRGRAVPIPAPGIQLTVVTHAADIADIIVTAVNQPEAAAGGIFNAVSGRAVTFDGLVRMCAKAAGMEADIVHYDPAAVGVDVKKAFPFRNMHFYAEPRAVHQKLGWSSVLDLSDILDARFEEYVSKGRFEKDLSFELDDKILAAVGK